MGTLIKLEAFHAMGAGRGLSTMLCFLSFCVFFCCFHWYSLLFFHRL